ncbi:site-specific integrase [Vibrio splendidus]|uniref:site-specific integrase n=1 Tax=Vibrio splendidus TaxID=29497 RepID=UPI002159306E|nr:site-specific integrase [Vibrio splendidus]
MRHLILACFHTGGQRPYELAASKWQAINWEERTWCVQPEISKNKRSHLIPLTVSTLEILKKQHRVAGDSPFIFPHFQNKDDHMKLDSLRTAITRYREDHPEIEHFVPRDFLRTCKTLMGEIGISKALRDRLQNHFLNDVSSKHYDRYDYLAEKRQAIALWEHNLCRVASRMNPI